MIRLLDSCYTFSEGMRSHGVIVIHFVLVRYDCLMQITLTYILRVSAWYTDPNFHI